MAKIKFVPWLDENAELTSTSKFFLSLGRILKQFDLNSLNYKKKFVNNSNVGPL